MPAIDIVRCSSCEVAFDAGWGGYTYATAPDGKRVVCPHPSEFHRAEEVTGLNWSEAHARGLIGFSSYCLCFECHTFFELDLDRDIKQCPRCASLQVRSARGAVGAACPVCHKGKFVEVPTGMMS